MSGENTGSMFKPVFQRSAGDPHDAGLIRVGIEREKITTADRTWMQTQPVWRCFNPVGRCCNDQWFLQVDFLFNTPARCVGHQHLPRIKTKSEAAARDRCACRRNFLRHETRRPIMLGRKRCVERCAGRSIFQRDQFGVVAGDLPTRSCVFQCQIHPPDMAGICARHHCRCACKGRAIAVNARHPVIVSGRQPPMAVPCQNHVDIW
ncbi:MAG: hypothetical protein AAGK28_05255 [Pseudomonadota bacterium]